MITILLTILDDHIKYESGMVFVDVYKTRTAVSALLQIRPRHPYSPHYHLNYFRCPFCLKTRNETDWYRVTSPSGSRSGTFRDLRCYKKKNFPPTLWSLLTKTLSIWLFVLDTETIFFFPRGIILTADFQGYCPYRVDALSTHCDTLIHCTPIPIWKLWN